MKKTTPMQAYANKRNKSAKKKAAEPAPARTTLGAQMGRDNYDAQYDLDTLTRAHAIKADGKRHSAALSEAKKKHAALKQVMGKA